MRLAGITTSSTKSVFFGLKGKSSWPSRLLIGFDMNCVTFHLKLLNPIQRNLTGSQIPTSSTMFVFSGKSENQADRPGLRFTETVSGSPLILLNRIHRNLTRSKIPIQRLWFLGRSENQNGHPVRSVNKGWLLYLCARYAFWFPFSS